MLGKHKFAATQLYLEKLQKKWMKEELLTVGKIQSLIHKIETNLRS